MILLTIFFFFNDTATTEIYTLSLHDALPILAWSTSSPRCGGFATTAIGSPSTTTASEYHTDDPLRGADEQRLLDRKSTRLNSSHGYISYAVFCLKKKTSRNKIRLHIVEFIRF